MGMAAVESTTLRLRLMQLVFGLVGFTAGAVALAMTFPTPPVFDIAMIDKYRPSVTTLASVLGTVSLLLSPWTIKAPSRFRKFVILSVVLAAMGLFSGLYVFSLVGA